MQLHLYGLFIALAVLVAVLYMGREARRLSLSADLPIDMALWAVPPAILFSRLYFVIFTWERFANEPLAILRFWEGGLAIYGGVIGGALGVLLLARRRRLRFATLADLVAPGLLIGQAIGRWGNFFNGEAYGQAVLDAAWQFFPYAVQVNGGWHQATFLYESLWNALGFLVLLRLRRRSDAAGSGTLFLYYLIWYALGRMMIEGLRTDSLMLGALRVSQVLSVVLIGFSGILLLLRTKRTWVLCVPLALGLVFLLLAALGSAWALLPGFFSLAGFVLLLLLPGKVKA